MYSLYKWRITGRENKDFDTNFTVFFDHMLTDESSNTRYKLLQVIAVVIVKFHFYCIYSSMNNELLWVE